MITDTLWTKDSELRFADFTIESIKIPVFWLDRESNFIRVNDAACKLFGYSKGEFLQKKVGDLQPEFVGEVWEAYWQEMHDNGSTHIQERLLKSNGESFLADIRESYIEFEGQSYSCAFVQDITEQKQLEDALRAVAQDTAGAVSGDDFFRSLTLSLSKALEVPFAFVNTAINGDITKLRTLAYVQNGKLGDNVEYDTSGTPCKLVMAGEEVFIPCELKKYFPDEEIDMDAYMGIPVYDANNNIIGDVGVFDTKPFVSGSEMYKSVMRIFATRAGAEMQRMKADQKLRESERSARLSHFTIEQATDAVFWITADASIKNVNEAACRQYGYTRDELKALSVFQFIKDYDAKNWPAVWAKIKSEKHLSFEGVHITKDGKEVPVEINANYIEFEGEEYSIAISRDITERKKAENNLRIALDEVERLKDRLEQENVYLQQEIKLNSNFQDITTQSTKVIEVLSNVEQVASTNATVLILGETGTGKELLARAIHSLSNRGERPLVKVNCASLPASLIESELFGHEKGAFTGALAQKIGRFELADGGTIFLDEIGELPIELQAKLLRVLQEGEFERLGNSRTTKVDVRVIAATNRDLQAEVDNGNFRADLFYRLNVFPLEIPPLRERKEDITLLVKHFIKKYGPQLGRKVETVPQKVFDQLLKYDWPGNIRELENIVERGMIISPGKLLVIGDWLPKTGYSIGASNITTLEESEREHIVQALELTNWKVSGKGGAAALLDIKPTTLEARMKKLGIQREG